MNQTSISTEDETPFDSFTSQFLHSRTNQRLSRRSQEIYQRDIGTLVDHLVSAGIEHLSEVTTELLQALGEQIIKADEGRHARASRTLAVRGLVGVSHARVQPHDRRHAAARATAAADGVPQGGGPGSQGGI